MQRSYRIKTTVTKSGNLSIKGLPLKPGEAVEVTVRRNLKKASVKTKYPCVENSSRIVNRLRV